MCIPITLQQNCYSSHSLFSDWLQWYLCYEQLNCVHLFKNYITIPALRSFIKGYLLQENVDSIIIANSNFTMIISTTF
jgi:hypothetical protein